MRRAFIKIEDNIFVPTLIGQDGKCDILDMEMFKRHSAAVYAPRIYRQATLDNLPRVHSYNNICVQVMFELYGVDDMGRPARMSPEEWADYLDMMKRFEAEELEKKRKEKNNENNGRDHL